MAQQTVLNPKSMDVQEYSFTFTQEGKPIIVIDSKGFNYKGELIDDSGEVYNLFKRYLEQSLTPIEIPSDEEIKSELRKIAVGDVMDENGEFIKSTIGVDDNIIWAIRGAKWMKEQILNQNK